MESVILIASALQQFANNDIQLIDIKQALENPKQASDLGLASADGLLLWEISHPDFSCKFQNSMINHDIVLQGKEPTNSGLI